MSHYLHFIDGKTKIQPSDLLKSSQKLNSRVKTHLSLTPSLGLLILYSSFHISVTFSETEVDSDLISWAWNLPDSCTVTGPWVLFNFP